MANTISYSLKPVSTNDGSLWTQYPWASVPNPFPPVDTTPPQSSLSYVVLRLKDVTAADKPEIKVEKRGLPIWLADDSFTIIGQPQTITGSNTVAVGADTVTCGAASFSRGSATYLIVPLVFVPLKNDKPDYGSEGYLSYVKNTRASPPLFDWTALIIAVFAAFLAVVVLSFLRGIASIAVSFFV